MDAVGVSEKRRGGNFVIKFQSSREFSKWKEATGSELECEPELERLWECKSMSIQTTLLLLYVASCPSHMPQFD